MSKERILKEATFSANAVAYQIMPLTIILAVTIIGIPLLVIVVPILLWYWRKYYARLRVILTTRDLKVHRGILNREEKSIPLEKITDLAVYEGPIMRLFQVKGIRVETAGQSSGIGALVTVVGIEGTDEFRDMVLNQRDRIADADDSNRSSSSARMSPTAAADGETLATLRDMRDSLNRIEQLLRDRS